jgi:hypothetical protein
MSNYERPKKTYTDFLNEVLENQGFNAPSIQEKLKNYIKVPNNNELKKDDHIRYFIWDNKYNKLKFRTGGFVKFINDDYLILTNKKNFNWSVQKKVKSNEGIVYRTLFYKKNYQNENENNQNGINQNGISQNGISQNGISQKQNLNISNDDTSYDESSEDTSSEVESSEVESVSQESYSKDNQSLDYLQNLSKEQLIQIFLNNYN